MSSGLMDVIWKPLEGVLSTFRDRLNPFWGLLEGFEVFWRVLEVSSPSWGLLEEVLEHLGASCETA